MVSRTKKQAIKAAGIRSTWVGFGGEFFSSEKNLCETNLITLIKAVNAFADPRQIEQLFIGKNLSLISALVSHMSNRKIVADPDLQLFVAGPFHQMVK